MKDDFDFVCPTKIYFRENGVGEIGKIIHDDYRFKKVFFIYGGSSLKKRGAYDKIVDSLKANGIEYREYGGIQKNPDIEAVNNILSLCRPFQPELILAAGGGSVLDTAKSVCHGYFYDGDPLDFNKHLVTPLHALPLATIITLSASGSERSDSCVISDRMHHFKGGFNSVTNYPLFSLEDPSLTFSVPPYQLGCGLSDRFSHSFERYCSPSHELEPCDSLALSIRKSVVSITNRVLAKADDREAKRARRICGSLSHDGFTNFGKKKLFIVHKAEHRLSGKYPDLVHGQGIALLMPSYLEENEAKLEEKIILLGKEVFGVTGSAKDAIASLKAWLDSLPIAHSFSELPFEIKKEDIEKAKGLLLLK